MKKTFVILFIFIIIAAGAFYYFEYYHKKKVDIWQMIPGNAILAYENQHTVENWNKIVDKPIWKTLEKVPYFYAWESGLAKADSLSGKDGDIDKLFRNESFIVSAHVTSSNDFDFIFYLDDHDGRAILEDVIQSIKKDKSIIAKARTFQGFTLNELIDNTGDLTFTYFVYENLVAGSFTPFLVEDVVRNVTNRFQDSFKARISALNNISKLDNDEGNLYIDFIKLPGLLNTFLKDRYSDKINRIPNFSGDTYLDIKVTDHELLLNGVSTVDLSGNNHFVGTFRNQEPGRIKVTDMLPNTTAILYDVTFSDFKEWQNQLTKYWSNNDKAQFQRYFDFEQKYNLKLDWIGGEAANAILESPGKPNQDQLIFIEINDKELAFSEMTSFAALIGKESGDSVYMELYNDLSIVQIPFSEFPSLIMGDYFLGFENSFVTIYGDFMVIGNSMQSVKLFLNAIEDENIWGKSIRQNIFLENTLSEASFSIIINTTLSWQMIMERLNEKWAELFKKYENQLKSFDRIAIQVSNLDRRFYTSIAVGHDERQVKQHSIGKLKKDQSIYVISPITTKPFIVKNHNNSKFEVLVQDSLNILYQVSNDGIILWGDSIQDRIVTEIHQIDYYKNSKLQYLFATANKIHLLDRNGDYVENFPIKLKPGVELEYLSVIDYDNSKRYRFMAVDKDGSIFLFNKEGNVLKGWNPRALDGQLASPGFHIRVKGGDCLIALQKNGVLNVLNRRGKMYPGFPIDLKTQIRAGIYVDVGNDFNKTRLITVSEEGEVIEVNLKGKIVKREQLYKPASESRFWLVNDVLGKTFVIVRQEYNKISILDRSGQIIMEKSMATSGNLFVQYYNFSTENQITVITDKDQEFAYIYNKNGEQISFVPQESSFPVGLLFSSREKEYKLYKCFGNNLSVLTFK